MLRLFLLRTSLLSLVKLLGFLESLIYSINGLIQTNEGSIMDKGNIEKLRKILEGPGIRGFGLLASPNDRPNDPPRSTILIRLDQDALPDRFEGEIDMAVVVNVSLLAEGPVVAFTFWMIPDHYMQCTVLFNPATQTDLDLLRGFIEQTEFNLIIINPSMQIVSTIPIENRGDVKDALSWAIGETLRYLDNVPVEMLNFAEASRIFLEGQPSERPNPPID